MSSRDADWFAMKRRLRHAGPLRHTRLGAAVAAGAPLDPTAFPGTSMPEPAGARERVVSSTASILMHALLIGPLVIAAWLAPHRAEEVLIEIERIPDQVEDQPKERESAPRPKIISESAGRFDPAPMAVAPMVVNPAVIQNRAQNVQAQQVQVAALAPVQAPTEIARPTALPIPQATAYQSPIQVPTAQPLDVNAASASLTGPVEIAAPVGTISGPKQVVTSGNTVGTGGPQSLGTGSSVREGIGSDRDVLGGKTGERATVNSAVGTIGGRGTGGSGTGPGGVSYEDCLGRAEVKMYIERVKDRTVSRWIAPGVTGTHKVTLRFRLDPSGAASQVQVISAGSPAVGDSAVEAMRAAAPFDQMSDRVRCLASHSLTGVFTLEDVTN